MSKTIKYKFVDKNGHSEIKTIQVKPKKKPILANYFDTSLPARKKRQQGFFAKMIADEKFVNGGTKNV